MGAQAALMLGCPRGAGRTAVEGRTGMYADLARCYPCHDTLHRRPRPTFQGKTWSSCYLGPDGSRSSRGGPGTARIGSQGATVIGEDAGADQALLHQSCGLATRVAGLALGEGEQGVLHVGSERHVDGSHRASPPAISLRPLLLEVGRSVCTNSADTPATVAAVGLGLERVQVVLETL